MSILTKEDLKLKTPVELEVMLNNKLKAMEDCVLWLGRHSSTEEEYQKILKDKQAIADEIVLINEMIKEKRTPIINTHFGNIEL